MRLRAGCNTVEFIVKLAGQSERVVAARVFLWGSEAKVVVSDVENTIARRFEGFDMACTPKPGVHFPVFVCLSVAHTLAMTTCLSLSEMDGNDPLISPLLSSPLLDNLCVSQKYVYSVVAVLGWVPSRKLWALVFTRVSIFRGWMKQTNGRRREY